jgi:predicted nucleotidyltransferase
MRPSSLPPGSVFQGSSLRSEVCGFPRLFLFHVEGFRTSSYIRRMKLTDTEVQQIVSKIGETFHPLQVLLFGSYAEGTATDDSDLDLLVVMESSEPWYARGASIRSLLWPPKAPMDILVYTPEEVARWNGVLNHVLTNAFKTGKVLYAA